MDSIMLTGSPLDDRGRLVHEDDPAAQMALATARLEAALATAGRRPAELTGLRVVTTDARTVAGVLDVLTDRLDDVYAAPLVEVVKVARLAVHGQLVTLETVLPTHHSSEGTRMSATLTDHTPAHVLRGLCSGGVHLPGDPGYDAARTPWNVAVDLRPAAVAIPQSVDEVIEVVAAATAAGLRIAPQSTGHGSGPLDELDLSDVVLLKLHDLTGVTVDPDAGTARVVGGTQWHEVVAAAAPYGFSALHGSAPDVAVAGYILSGGVSFYGRTHGLAVNSVRAVEVVTADGTLLRADATENPDLFWAIRGGGANLGVVVALEIALLPQADVFAGMLLWDREHAPEVVRAWARWTREVPDSVTTSLRVMSFPPLPELPPFLSGRQLVVIDGAVLEDDARAAELLAPLRALAPEMDTFGRMPVAGLLEIHMDPPVPSPAVGDHAVLGEITEETIEALLGEVGPGVQTPLLFAELRHLGGALGRPDPAGGALSCLRGDYALFCLAIAPTPEARTGGRAAAAAVVRALAPWSVASRVPTFTENRENIASAFADEDWTRLTEVVATHAPGRTFVANHAV